VAQRSALLTTHTPTPREVRVRALTLTLAVAAEEAVRERNKRSREQGKLDNPAFWDAKEAARIAAKNWSKRSDSEQIFLDNFRDRYHKDEEYRKRSKQQ